MIVLHMIHMIVEFKSIKELEDDRFEACRQSLIEQTQAIIKLIEDYEGDIRMLRTYLVKTLEGEK